MKIIGIYKITNLVNKKIYVGQSIDIKERWHQHTYKAFNNKELGYNSAIHVAMRKYGLDNFSFEILEECSVEDLDVREKFWIKELNSLCPNGYNILTGGQNQRSELTFCCDCGARISKGAKRCISCNAKKNRANYINSQNIPLQPIELAHQIKEKGFEQVGRDYGVSGNAVKKWCKTYGIPHLKNEVIDWYNNEMGIKVPKKKPLKTPVNQIDISTGEIINTFESATAAAESLGKNKGSHITEVCKGTHSQAYGYFWEYADVGIV